MAAVLVSSGNLKIISDVPVSSELPDMPDLFLMSSDFDVDDVEESGPRSNEISPRFIAFLGLVSFSVRKSGFSRSLGFSIDFDRSYGILLVFETCRVFLPIFEIVGEISRSEFSGSNVKLGLTLTEESNLEFVHNSPVFSVLERTIFMSTQDFSCFDLLRFLRTFTVLRDFLFGGDFFISVSG